MPEENANRGSDDADEAIQMIWPVVLIVAGLLLLLAAVVRRWKRRDGADLVMAALPSSTSSFRLGGGGQGREATAVFNPTYTSANAHPVYASADFTPDGEWGTAAANPDVNNDEHQSAHEPVLSGSAGLGAEPEYAGFGAASEYASADSTRQAYANAGIVGGGGPYDDLRGARRMYSHEYATLDSTRQAYADAGIVGGGGPYDDLRGARRVYSRDASAESSVAGPLDSYEETGRYEELTTGSGYEDVNDGLDGVYAEISESAMNGGAL